MLQITKKARRKTIKLPCKKALKESTNKLGKRLCKTSIKELDKTKQGMQEVTSRNQAKKVARNWAIKGATQTKRK